MISIAVIALRYPELRNLQLEHKVLQQLIQILVFDC